MSQGKPLYFLTHEGQPHIFSGFGMPLEEGKKSPLAGVLMLDRPTPCPDWYLQVVHDVFGENILFPMTEKGERGLYTQMKIEDPFSLDLLLEDLYSPKEIGHLGEALNYILENKALPKPRLKLSWSKARGFWVSKFDL